MCGGGGGVIPNAALFLVGDTRSDGCQVMK